MDDFGFDISNIVSGDEAEKLFSDDNFEQETEQEEETVETPQGQEENLADDVEHQEEVSEEENSDTEKKAVHRQGDGSSPNPYSSIARALKIDGSFSDVSDEEIDGIKSPEDFNELFDKVVEAKLNEKQKRINDALNSGVEPSTIQKYEQTIQYLDSIDEDALRSEGEEGENLRRQLIFNDLITNRGYSEEKAQKIINASFNSGSDIEDAEDALEGLKKFYGSGYQKILDESKSKANAERAAQKEQAEVFRKMIVDDDVKIGSIVVDKRTKQRVFDAVSKPTYKDPKTGKVLTEIQKFQQEHPLEFLKQIGLWFVMTDGGKSVDKLIKERVREEKNKGIRELEHKINSSSFNTDGSLKYAGGETSSQDLLLSDDWKIGQ